MDYQSKRALAARAESAEALRALAAEQGISLTGEEAQSYFAKLHPPAGELSDEELEAVSGGGCGGAGYTGPPPTQVYFAGDEVPNTVNIPHAGCPSIHGFRVAEARLVGPDSITPKPWWEYRLECISCGAKVGWYDLEQMSATQSRYDYC